MEFSIAALLASFAKDKTLTLKNLEKKLHCTSDMAQRELQIAVDALERLGVLVKDRGKYRRQLAENVVEGKLRCSSKGFCFAIQDQDGTEDIYVRENHLSTAWNGDRVLVKVTKEGVGRRSPEGEVQLILERANASVLARVKRQEEEYRAVPLDDRLLFELQLMVNDIDLETAVDQLAHVEIVRYPLGQSLPLGRVAQVLGSDAETASDIDIVYCKHDLPRTFSGAVLAATAELPARIRKTDLKGRLDLRQSLTLAITGPQSQVVDDALTLEKDQADRWRLGIHIVDIAQYVTAHGAIDHEAAKRGSAVYLGSEVVPLLPPGLMDGLGSLSVGKDRLVLSVLVTLDDRGKILEYEVQPAVISLDYQITYAEAHGVLERDNQEVLASLGIDAKAMKTWEPIFDLMDNLLYLSQAIKRQRLQRGSFELNLPEYDFPVDAQEPLAHYRSPKFQYDDEGLLGVMVVSKGGLSRAIVSECMVLANQLVAQHLKALGVPALYRLHRAPELTEVQELIKLVENMGLSLGLANPEAVEPLDYQIFVQQFASSEQEKILTYLLLETIQPAFYGTHPGLHFGLALGEAYTHFTSPSQRYADLVIQRILHAIFEAGRDRRTTRSKEVVNLRHSSCHGQVGWNILPPEIQHELEDDLGRLAIHLTERERLAQEAESDLEGLKKAEFMRSHTGEVFHGLITGVQSYGFFVEIEDLLVEGLVHVSSLKDDWYEYRARQQKLVGRKNLQQYCLGDQVDVQVKSVDYYRQQIDLVAVGGGSRLSEDEAQIEGEELPEDLGQDDAPLARVGDGDE